MPCNNLTGPPFFRGVLVRESSEVIEGLDPILRFVVEDEQLYARFDGSADRFPVTCTEEGDNRRLSFRRVAGRVITDYSGLAVPISGRAVFFIVRGTFTRVTTEADGTRTTVNGDWETEKPT